MTNPNSLNEQVSTLQQLKQSRQTNTNTCLTLIIISNYQHAIFYTVIVSWNCYSTKEETTKTLFHVFFLHVLLILFIL